MNQPEFMRRFIALLRKEVRQMLRDKSNLAVGLLLPIALILLFGKRLTQFGLLQSSLIILVILRVLLAITLVLLLGKRLTQRRFLQSFILKCAALSRHCSNIVALRTRDIIFLQPANRNLSGNVKHDQQRRESLQPPAGVQLEGRAPRRALPEFRRCFLGVVHRGWKVEKREKPRPHSPARQAMGKKGQTFRPPITLPRTIRCQT